MLIKDSMSAKQRALADVTQNQSIVCSVSVQKRSKWKNTEITLDTEIKMNIISQHFAIKLKLKFMKDVKLPQSEWINKQTMFCYRIYQMTIQITNIWNWKKNNIHIFYSLNKTDIFLILNMLYFQIEDIMINCVTSL